MRFVLLLLLAPLLTGCAVDAKHLDAAGTATAGVLGFYSTTAQLNQQLVEATIKESAQLEFLTGQTCWDNPGAKKSDYYQARNIAFKVMKRFETRDDQYKFLVKYSNAFSAIIKENEEVQSIIDDLLTTGESIAKYNAELASLAVVARLVQKAGKAVGEAAKYAAIREAAKAYQHQLEDHVDGLSRRLTGLDSQTAKRVAIWRTCVEEKFTAMKDFAKKGGGNFSTSVVELDTAYGAFQTQYRSFVVTSPQVGSMLEDLVKANKAIWATLSPAEIRASADLYVKIFDASKDAIATSASLQKQ
jgi:hypothetical protein